MPHSVMIGKMLQCAALVTVGPQAGKDRFLVFPDGPPTTTWQGERAVRLAAVLRFLNGSIPLRPISTTSSNPSTLAQYFHLNISSEMGSFHTTVKTILERHWGESDFRSNGHIQPKLWGCGLIWFVDERRYLAEKGNDVLMASLDAEKKVRCILPLRPVARLGAELERMFPPKQQPVGPPPAADKKRGRTPSPAPGDNGEERSGGRHRQRAHAPPR